MDNFSFDTKHDPVSKSLPTGSYDKHFMLIYLLYK